MNVYFISGLGADKRAFQRIKLPEKFNIIHINWCNPLKNESFINYCIRLSNQIEKNKPFVLIGLSFGGIVATELSKIYSPLKTIIISSVPTFKDIPWYFRLLGKMKLNQAISSKLLKCPNPFTFWIFGAKTIEEKKLITQILNDTGDDYLKWSIDSILNWNNEEKPKFLVHIHGTNDHILPVRFTKPDIIVKGGGHFMIFTLAQKLNEILEKELGFL